MDGLYTDIDTKKSIGLLKTHFHSYHELYYLSRGQMRYIIDDRLYEVTEGDVVLIPKGTLHNTSYDNYDTERLLINFDDSFILDKRLLSCFDKKIITLSDKHTAEFESLFKKLTREGERCDEYSKLLASQYVSEILVMLQRCEQRQSDGKSANIYTAVIQRAMEYISENFASPLTLDEVAKEVSLSRSFFSRKFKEITGFGFSEYLTHVRIKRAAELLARGDLSVTDVAFSCGFEGSSYFAASFKKIMGATPLKYAKGK